MTVVPTGMLEIRHGFPQVTGGGVGGGGGGMARATWPQLMLDPRPSTARLAPIAIRTSLRDDFDCSMTSSLVGQADRIFPGAHPSNRSWSSASIARGPHLSGP